jgi:dTDP-L-rhamnose 4-epimerase
MSVYGEGTYRAADGRLITRARRLPQRLRNGTWDIYEEFAQEPLRPVATPESKPLDPLSIYGLSKCDQERMCLMLGKAYGIPTTALRLFNVFGYRQTLSNPYSGILAVCASRFLDDKAPLLFEDGQQIRDFVHVRDVARSFRLALENPLAADRSFNIASGTGRTIQSVARMMSGLVNRGYLEPIISNRYRSGDIRHCFADMTAARTLLGFESRVPLEEGLEEVVEWVERTTNKSPVWVVAGETAAGRQQYSGERLRHWSW